MPIRYEHKMSVKEARQELEAEGFTLARQSDVSYLGSTSSSSRRAGERAACPHTTTARSRRVEPRGDRPAAHCRILYSRGGSAPINHVTKEAHRRRIMYGPSAA